MRARHRLSKLPLRHAALYDAAAWTRAHDAWLRTQRFQDGATTQLIPSSAHERGCGFELVLMVSSQGDAGATDVIRARSALVANR